MIVFGWIGWIRLPVPMARINHVEAGGVVIYGTSGPAWCFPRISRHCIGDLDYSVELSIAEKIHC
jgi:hypothetical protein